jgi:hypothetical protein
MGLDASMLILLAGLVWSTKGWTMNDAAIQCQVCWRVQNDSADGKSCATWLDLQTFMDNYKATSHLPRMSEGYCPQCTTLYHQLTQEQLYDA